MATRVSSKGLVEIASHEGIVNAPYRDSVGVWTVGVGHTASAGAPDPAVKRGAYSMTEIMDIFARDIAGFEAGVRRAFTVPLKQHEFDAALSFHFNTGAIERATWVKKFNAGDRAGAKRAFMNWRKPPEIIPRRRKERDLFFDGVYSSNGSATLYPADSAGKVLWGRGKRVDVLAMMKAENAVPIPTPRPQEPVRDAREDVSMPETPQRPERPPASKSRGVMTILAAAVVAWLIWAWEGVTSFLTNFLTQLFGG